VFIFVSPPCNFKNGVNHGFYVGSIQMNNEEGKMKNERSKEAERIDNMK